MASPSRRHRPTWLNQLPAHSIFELDEQEYLEWSSRANNTNEPKPLLNKSLGSTQSTNNNSPFGGSAQQKGFGFSSGFGLSSGIGFNAGTGHKEPYGLDDLQDEYQQSYQGLSCMALHGQDLYVAVGRQIRHTSLAELKKGVENHGHAAATEFIEKKQHKVLKIQNIDFDIRRLVMNQDGNLLAIVGDEKIIVAAVTKMVKQDSKSTNLKSFVLGEYYHINKGPSKIVKVLWHPLSKGFSHVLVMTHDNILRMYNVAKNPDEPEQVFSFAQGDHGSAGYGMDMDIAASFCFGSKYSPWGQLTVYSLTQGGEIYMMCPIMPSTCLLDASDLDDMRFYMEHEAIIQGESKELEEARRDWLWSLLESQHAHPFSDEIIIVKSPVLKLAKPVRQGPFCQQPKPMELDDDDNTASDILCLETEAAEVMAVAHSCGKVDIFIAVDRPAPRWSLPRRLRTDGRYAGERADQEDKDIVAQKEWFPTLSVYESIDLGLLKTFAKAPKGYGLQERGMSIPNHPVLAADINYGDTFYVYHEAGAHCISIRPWLDELNRIYDAASQRNVTGMEARIIEFYESKVKSIVGCIVTTRPTQASIPAPIVGFAVVVDQYLEYSLLLLTSSLQLIGLELMTRTGITQTPSPSSTPAPGASTIVQKENEYQNSLTLPGFGSQDGLLALNGLPIQPKIVLPPGVGAAKITVTEENLQFLGKIVQGYREALREVYTACDLAQQRLVAQEIEYERQQKSVAQCHERRGTFAKRLQEQVDRQDQQVAYQQKLMARADELLQRVKESREPELSVAEKEWAVDVAKREKAVKAFDERRHKVQARYEILKRRMVEMQSSLDRDDRRSMKNYGTGQIHAVANSLSDESQLLDSTMKMAKDLMSRMEVLSISDVPTTATTAATD